MTDYLELLLEQAQDEWDEQPLEWKKPARVPPAVKEDRPGQEERRSGGMAAEDDSVQAKRRNLAETAEAPARREADFLEQLVLLERAASRVGTEKTGARGNRQNAGVTAETPVRFGTVVAGNVPTAATHLAAALDAAFERDARRYDGPLGLL